ncbi:hypothetical protein [Nocardia iowensis]|nr:hypothetical protein [Nocardia iowensis]
MDVIEMPVQLFLFRLPFRDGHLWMDLDQLSPQQRLSGSLP